MKSAFLALIFLLPAAAHAADRPATVSDDALVRVNSTNQPYDFFRPWTKKNPFQRRGLGVVLSGQRILVTAELVANHNYVELEKASTAEKCPAEVVVVDYDSNLALLKPVDPAFLKDAPALELASGAKVGDRAEILQLESNNQIAQTPAVVTTITVAPYPSNNLALLTYRLSAPLQNREGSFTIPAVRDGRLLGLLMRYDARSQTTELIPPPVISHFLADAAGEKYTGFPRAGVAFSPTRDPQLRRYIGLQEGGGVYVNEVLADGPADKAGLRRGDIILAVAGKAIDQDGNYQDPENGKISFSHLTNTLAKIGDTIELTVLREGKKETLKLTLEPQDRTRIVSEPYVIDQAPRYVVLGGLVFQELSRSYLQEWGGGWPKDAPQRLVYLDAFQQELPKDRGKVVFLSQVLPTPMTLGYENLGHLVVTKVNGVAIKNLNDLASAAARPEKGFHKVEFEDDPGVIYLDANDVEKGKSALMEDYGLPALENLSTEN